MSYVLGTNELLGGTSPLLHIATTGRRGAEQQLRALASVIDPDLSLAPDQQRFRDQ